jgi:hypothetical protein
VEAMRITGLRRGPTPALPKSLLRLDSRAELLDLIHAPALLECQFYACSGALDAKTASQTAVT